MLDLGSGDGRLLDLVLRARPGVRGVALDFMGGEDDPVELFAFDGYLLAGPRR